jgi:hypothetical protein
VSLLQNLRSGTTRPTTPLSPTPLPTEAELAVTTDPTINDGLVDLLLQKGQPLVSDAPVRRTPAFESWLAARDARNMLGGAH